MDILSTFCSVFVVLCVKLMLRIFEFRVLLFDCFVCRQNVTCLKRFTRYGHYAGKVEDNHRQTVKSEGVMLYMTHAYSVVAIFQAW